MQALYGCSVSYIDALEIFTGLKFELLEAQSFWFALYQQRETQKLVHDALCTYATHRGLVHDVTNTKCQAQNGSAHDRVFATFVLLLMIFNKLDRKSTEKTL